MIYTCPLGLHDDLGISCAMLCWAARHPHLQYWRRPLEAARRPRRPRQRSELAGMDLTQACCLLSQARLVVEPIFIAALRTV